MVCIGMTIKYIVSLVLAAFLLMELTNSIENRSEDNAYVIELNGDALYINDDVIVEDVIDYVLTSLDGMGQHLLVIHGERSDYSDDEGYENAVSEGHIIGGMLRFYELTIELEDNHVIAEEIYENDFTRVNPWCIDAGHMDDNGHLDVFIGAFRATRVYEPDRRPFFFEWTESKLKRIWTGSYLNMRTFYEAGLEDVDGDGIEELYAIQPNDEDGLSKYIYSKGSFTYYLKDEIKY